MRKKLLALAALLYAATTMLLLLATFDVWRGATLPLGLLFGIGGLTAAVGVLLVGQQTLMVRTSQMAYRLGADGAVAKSNGPPAAGVDDALRKALRESNEALTWSLDARIVGLAEHLSAERNRDPESTVSNG